MSGNMNTRRTPTGFSQEEKNEHKLQLEMHPIHVGQIEDWPRRRKNVEVRSGERNMNTKVSRMRVVSTKKIVVLLKSCDKKKCKTRT